MALPMPWDEGISAWERNATQMLLLLHSAPRSPRHSRETRGAAGPAGLCFAAGRKFSTNRRVAGRPGDRRPKGTFAVLHRRQDMQAEPAAEDICMHSAEREREHGPLVLAGSSAWV